jgi:hypothetical protein
MEEGLTAADLISDSSFKSVGSSTLAYCAADGWSSKWRARPNCLPRLPIAVMSVIEQWRLWFRYTDLCRSKFLLDCGAFRQQSLMFFLKSLQSSLWGKISNCVIVPERSRTRRNCLSDHYHLPIASFRSHFAFQASDTALALLSRSRKFPTWFWESMYCSSKVEYSPFSSSCCFSMVLYFRFPKSTWRFCSWNFHQRYFLTSLPHYIITFAIANSPFKAFCAFVKSSYLAVRAPKATLAV